jgi:excisionase family DNA binding protein
VSPDLRAGLRALAEALPQGAAVTVTVPREALIALLGQEPPKASPTDSARLLDVDEVAARLGVKKQFIYRNKQSLGAVRVGRAVRFSEQAVGKYLARRSIHRLGPAPC